MDAAEALKKYAKYPQGGYFTETMLTPWPLPQYKKDAIVKRMNFFKEEVFDDDQLMQDIHNLQIKMKLFNVEVENVEDPDKHTSESVVALKSSRGLRAAVRRFFHCGT